MTVEKVVMAETMSSGGEGARALCNHAASPAWLSQGQLVPSDKHNEIKTHVIFRHCALVFQLEALGCYTIKFYFL